MDDIDQLIKKYGYSELLNQIIARRSTHFFEMGQKKGRPKLPLQNYLGLRQVMAEIRTEYPNESADTIAKKLLIFINNYRNWQKNTDIYKTELSKNSERFKKVAWLGSYGKKKITSKAIVNELRKLEVEINKRSNRISKINSFLNSSENFTDDETFEDYPFDTEAFYEQEFYDLILNGDDQPGWL